MCGLCGVILGDAKRSKRELNQVADMFTRLLLLSEHRGPYATGAASIKLDGSMSVVKLPLPAHQFVDSAEYRSWLGTIAPDTTYLMGHTRWPTRGSIYNLENDHPLVAKIGAPCGGHVALTHNGAIREPERHFRRLRLPRTAQVDSELLVRLAQRHAGPQGLDIGSFIAHLPMLHGRMSAALVATTKPNEVFLLKGNMPLEVRLQRGYNTIAYASESGILSYALKDHGWEDVFVSAEEGLVIDSYDIPSVKRFRFEFGERVLSKR